MVSLQKRAKIVGLIITECPVCGNAINFDRRDTKVCPYCGAEAHIDLSNVLVSVWGEAGSGSVKLMADGEPKGTKKRAT